MANLNELTSDGGGLMQRVPVRMPTAQIEELDALAERAGMSRAALIRRLLEHAVADLAAAQREEGSGEG